MKKAILAAALIGCTTLTSCSLAGAGAALAGLGGNGAKVSSTAAGVGQTVVGALTDGNALGNLLSTFIGGAKISEASLYGTWTYQSVDVAFESENLLAKAGGAVVAGNIETKIDEQLQKYGIRPGSVKFTFKQDKTFTATIGGKSLNGTYTFDEKTRKLTLVAALGLFTQTCTVGTTAKGISLLFPADKLLGLVSTVGAFAGNVNSNLSSITGLLNNYSGMQIGLELSK